MGRAPLYLHARNGVISQSESGKKTQKQRNHASSPPRCLKKSKKMVDMKIPPIFNGKSQLYLIKTLRST